MRERMLRGDLYLASDSELTGARRRAADLLFRLNGTSNAERKARRVLLTELLGAIGPETTIISPFFCDYGSQITIGQRCFVNAGAVMLDPAAVVIGDDVQIGPNVQLLTATHPVDAAERASGWELAQPITIGSGTWLGGGAIIGPGVTVGEGTVVGAGSVVVRDLPAYVVAVGNPARVIRQLA
ncbi:MAG TPA: sugar O-acetyltransferase [Candidatus Limnocylindria bacterium]|nr:sugar O-acetyltransferase [Candidatus Limnocylindria bacterium]